MIITKFEKIDLASKNPDKLADFYHKVFGVSFEKIVHFGLNHYLGEVGGVELFICPNQPANVNDNAEGIQQFHVEVNIDLSKLSEIAKSLNCEVLEDVNFDPDRKQICLRDPDGNPWIVSQRK